MQRKPAVSNTEASEGLCAGAAYIAQTIRPVENKKFLSSLVRLLADGAFGTSQKHEIVNKTESPANQRITFHALFCRKMNLIGGFS
ncbi:MAG: hypothetical protein EOM06_11710 [Sphingobacteriia bacterium]|nr:hypothetical protein [Sphingobacteriia bacterium]